MWVMRINFCLDWLFSIEKSADVQHLSGRIYKHHTLKMLELIDIIAVQHHIRKQLKYKRFEDFRVRRRSNWIPYHYTYVLLITKYLMFFYIFCLTKYFWERNQITTKCISLFNKILLTIFILFLMNHCNMEVSLYYY